MNLKENNDDLSGEWVLIFKDEIIDHSANIEDMLRLAEQKFPTDKYPQDMVKISKILSGTYPQEKIWNR
jgi:hypothetical protein